MIPQESRGRRAPVRAGTLLVAALLSGRVDAQDPPPSPSPSPSPERLRLDIDRLVKELDERKGIPRFEDRVEVVGKSPQAMIDRFFGGIEYDCSPPGGVPKAGGAPSHVEMREARWHPSPSADFEAALLKILAEAFKGKMRGPDKYFLYRVNTKGEVSYLLREGRVPEAVLYSTPGTTYELIKEYADTKSGVKALRRLERGFATTEAKDAPPPADWQTSTCRPR